MMEQNYVGVSIVVVPMNLFFHLLDRSHVAYGLLNSGRLGACIGEGLEVGSIEENRGK